MCSSRRHVNHGRIRVFHGIIDTIHSTADCLEAFSMCQYLHRLHDFLFGQVLAGEKQSRCLNTSGGTTAAERQPLLETQRHEAPVLRASSGGMVAVQCLCGRNTTWLEGKKPPIYACQSNPSGYNDTATLGNWQRDTTFPSSRRVPCEPESRAESAKSKQYDRTGR